MKIKQLLWGATALLLSCYVHGQDVTNNKFGKGLINIIAADSSYSMNFAARFQTLYTSDWSYPNNSAIHSHESAFTIRRARLKFDGFAYTPKLQYKIELGLSNNDIAGADQFNDNTPRYILDAVAKWNFYGNFELWGGQTKLPGNRERVISSGNMETVDRSLVNAYYNIDRDMGVQLHHSFNIGENFLVREAIAVSQGEGRNITEGNLGGYQYTARAEVLPFGDFDDYIGGDLKRHQTPKLSVGATFDYNDNAVRTRSNMGSYMFADTESGVYETDVKTFFLDAMFKYRGFSFMGEYAKRTADNPIAMNEDGTLAVDEDGNLTGDAVNIGDGLNLQAGYVFKNNYQILGRYTTISPDAEVSAEGVETQYTLGLSKYILGHKLKVQTDISLNDYEDNANNSLMYRLQFDIHF